MRTPIRALRLRDLHAGACARCAASAVDPCESCMQRTPSPPTTHGDATGSSLAHALPCLRGALLRGRRRLAFDVRMRFDI